MNILMRSNLSFRNLLHYEVYDNTGVIKYLIVPRIISLDYEYRVKNAKDEEVNKFVFPMFFGYPGYLKEKDVIKAKLNFKPWERFTFICPELGLEIKSFVFLHDYIIKKDGKVIATIHKKWLSIFDSYEITYQENGNEIDELTYAFLIVGTNFILKQITKIVGR